MADLSTMSDAELQALYQQTQPAAAPTESTAQAAPSYKSVSAMTDDELRAAASTNVAVDVAKSVPTGLAVGTIGLAGLPGDLGELGAKGIDKATKAVGGLFGLDLQRPGTQQTLSEGITGPGPRKTLTGFDLPGGAEIKKGVESYTGAFYEPKTGIGKVAHTAGEFLPALLGGPETLFAKLATRVAAPTAGTELVGAMTDNPLLKGAGAVAGSVLAHKATGKFTAPPEAPELAGIDPKALDWASKAARADGLTEAQITAKLQQLGPKGFLAEYGPNLQGLTSAVASQPGAGKAKVFEAIEGRSQAARGAVDESLTNAFGAPVNLVELSKQREAARKAAADPLYKRFRETVIPMTPELGAILEKPTVKAALPNAAKLAADEGVPILNAAGHPTAQTWDYLKRAVDDKARAAGFGTNEARVAGGISREIRAAIDNHPDPNVAGVWKAARQAHAEPMGIQEAAEQGLNWRKLHKDELAPLWEGFSQPEKTAFMQGMRRDIADIFDSTRRGDTKARDLLLAAHAQDKSRILVGDAKTNQLVQDMERLKGQADTRSTVLYNSQTEPRRAMGELVKPDPNETFLSRLRHLYAPHVTPFAWLPLKGLETMAAGRQAAKFEAGRNALAPLLVKQGDEAAAIVRALANRPEKAPEWLNWTLAAGRPAMTAATVSALQQQ